MAVALGVSQNTVAVEEYRIQLRRQGAKGGPDALGRRRPKSARQEGPTHKSLPVIYSSTQWFLRGMMQMRTLVGGKV